MRPRADFPLFARSGGDELCYGILWDDTQTSRLDKSSPAPSPALNRHRVKSSGLRAVPSYRPIDNQSGRDEIELLDSDDSE